MTNRPRCLIVVTGTGTSIGKTWVAAATLRELRAAGWRVAARKPAQSYAAADPTPTDAAVLAEATGEEIDMVCPTHRSYPIALAPVIAAEALGRSPMSIDDLSRELAASWTSTALDAAFVEGAGGVASPQAVDGDTATLIEAINPDLVILVADAELGTINLVRLCLRFLGNRRPITVHLNRYDPDSDVHQSNLRWLREREALTVTTDTASLAALARNHAAMSSHQHLE
jgi:dethiobiotin synthetase